MSEARLEPDSDYFLRLAQTPRIKSCHQRSQKWRYCAGGGRRYCRTVCYAPDQRSLGLLDHDSDTSQWIAFVEDLYRYLPGRQFFRNSDADLPDPLQPGRQTAELDLGRPPADLYL